MPLNQEQRERFCEVLHNLLCSVCTERNVQIVISPAALADVVLHHSGDMDKLGAHQGTAISVNKRIAGLIFWIRRLKPITMACLTNFDGELQDINEQAAVWIAHRLLLAYCETQYAWEKLISLNIKDKKKEFGLYLQAYWSIGNWFNFTSLVYNLRYRNFSPHHLAILLDTLTTGFILKHTILQPGSSRQAGG